MGEGQRENIRMVVCVCDTWQAARVSRRPLPPLTPGCWWRGKNSQVCMNAQRQSRRQSLPPGVEHCREIKLRFCSRNSRLMTSGTLFKSSKQVFTQRTSEAQGRPFRFNSGLKVPVVSAAAHLPPPFLLPLPPFLLPLNPFPGRGRS
jgi:hypothetical protein